jgi:hypothetical protein
VIPTSGIGMMSTPIMPSVMPGLLPGLYPNILAPGMGMQTQQPQKSAADNIDPALKKVFVKNVPAEVPDSFMELILKVKFFRCILF